MLTRLDTLPPGFVDTPASELHRLLPGPALVRLPGAAPQALFVSVLQHGNEHTGLEAVQRLLAGYGSRPLPRPLWLFIGNPDAARQGHRRLDHQPDLNRCWPGTELPASPETRMLEEVVAALRGEPLLASLDIHNTTGDSPHYAGVNILDDRCLQLASLFTRTVVYFTRPRGAQSQALLGLCPAITLECGRVGNDLGSAHAHDFLERCLRLESVPERPPAPGEIDLFESVALVQVPHGVRLRFGPGAGADLVLDPELDRLNFRELEPGTVLGEVRGG
ncbi:MAG: M14 family metallopeptidase, partial [Halofilum sp. (in: g-proteobacteria)]|nr:M14 family metallopeptidase [Halofilum sp. (in: g-proteobacteria)]